MASSTSKCLGSGLADVDGVDETASKCTCGKPSNKPLWACGGAFASCCRMDYADKGLEAPDANAIKEELSRNSQSQAALKTPKPS